MSWYHFKFKRGGNFTDILFSVLVASIVRFRYIWDDENSADPTCKLPPYPFSSAKRVRDWFYMIHHEFLRIHMPARIENLTDSTSRIAGDDVETLVWTPVECCVGVICACIPCMAPLRRLINRGSARAGYKPTSEGRAGEIPLTTRAWPEEHSMVHSQHGKNDEESGEFGEVGWASKMDTATNKAGESEPKTQVYASDFRSVVVNGASADPKANGISEEIPSNHIKVSKDLMWSEETTKGRGIC